MKEDILQTIIAHKRREIEAQEQAVSLSALEALDTQKCPDRSNSPCLSAGRCFCPLGPHRRTVLWR